MIGGVLVAGERQLEKGSLSAVHRQSLPKCCSSCILLSLDSDRFERDRVQAVCGRWTSDHGDAVVTTADDRGRYEQQRPTMPPATGPDVHDDNGLQLNGGFEVFLECPIVDPLVSTDSDETPIPVVRKP